jgi:hypothetical protein
MAAPLASGREGFFGALVFGIAGLQAAYDVVGLLGLAPRSGNLVRDAYAKRWGWPSSRSRSNAPPRLSPRPTPAQLR